MPVRRGDKWEGRLKIAGRVVRTRRFDTKRSAMAWEQRQRTTFDEHGYDPSAGKVAVEDLLPEWLEQRAGRVSQTTLDTDRFLLPTEGQLAGTSRREPVLPLWFRKLHVVKVTGSAIDKWQIDLGKRDLVATTVCRYRNSLSSFFKLPLIVLQLVRGRGLHRPQPGRLHIAAEGPPRPRGHAPAAGSRVR